MSLMRTRAALALLSSLAIVASGSRVAKAKPIRRARLDSTLLFSVANAVNGGFVGAVGPSLPAFKAATGLGEAALGRVVLINRLSKLVGTFAWTSYAKRLEAGHKGLPPPRLLLSACLIVAAACALTIGSPACRGSGLTLQAALSLFGASYGFTDPAFTLLTIWSLHDSARQQRTHVGYLNAGYTLGALATPALVALSLSQGGTIYPCFYALAGVALLAGCALATLGPHDVAPPPPVEKVLPVQVAAEGPTAADRAAASTWRDRVVVASMCLVLFSVTGCEHGVATWLPTFGERVAKVPLQTSAMISAAYWGAICVGRLMWAALSHAVSSGWLVLAMDGATMLLSSLFFVALSATQAATHGLVADTRAAQLLAGALIMALGFASSLPCAITMPSEAGVLVTPGRLLAMNLAGSAGESLMPFLFGAAFERGWDGAFGASLVMLNVAMLTATAVARRSTRRFKRKESDVIAALPLVVGKR